VALLNSSELPLPDLGDMASTLHLSQRVFNRRLQQEGSSFRELKTDVMPRWGKRLLKEADLSVEAVAATLGYQDSANFYRAFRRQEGCPPSKYRKS
jgi:AraC-like DNA-binding protein